MKMIKIVFLVLLFPISMNIRADESLEMLRQHYPIDDKFNAGEYLVYNCFKKNFACVELASYQDCNRLRRIDLDENKEEYRCAPLKKFDTKRDCVIYQYKVVDLDPLKRFCFRDKKSR